jgi:hypothetical protein
MKTLLLSCFLIYCELAQGQSDVPYTREYVYLGAAPGTAPIPPSTSFGFLPGTQPPIVSVPPTNNWYTGGVGLERLLAAHVGVGLDLGGIVPGQGKILSNTVGSFSPNVYFHWEFKSAFDVFGTGGYSLLFQSFTANYYNFGGGLNYWLGINQTHGLMVEYRRLNPIDTGRTYNEIRFGYTVR